MKLLLNELAEAAVDKNLTKAKKAIAEIWKSKVADEEIKKKSRRLYASIPVPKQYEIVAKEIEKLGRTAMKELEKAMQPIGADSGDLEARPETKMEDKAPPPPTEMEDEKIGLQPIWFATNRLLRDEDKYGNERSHTTFGKAYVTLPSHHQIGETGRNYVQRCYDWCTSWFKPVLEPPKVVFISPFSDDEKLFFTKMNYYVQREEQTGRSPNALIYIHGYKNSFESAAVAAAQLKVDLKLRGPVAFFSWPSMDSYTGYFADETIERLSRDQIRDFIADFTRYCGCEKVHVLAHSMGTRALLHAILRLSSEERVNRELRLGQVIFTAADIDKEEFECLCEQINPALRIDRKTLYAAHGDKALALSQYLGGRPRAGKYYPFVDVTRAGVELIAVPTYVEMEFFGHGYFRDAHQMLTDLHQLIWSPDIQAEDRAVTVRAQDENGNVVDGVWSIRNSQLW